MRTVTVGAVRERNTYLPKIDSIISLKRYIKYKNLRDRLCIKLVCPFCVQKEGINIG